ncbi:hypothetical protein PPERSA_03909 [Pseudocohnilembus persalinus]|uniref:Dolichyl-diphosphooligosaccharide--protein glycosyltransferase subunit 1 n=1 Tax=Pseudocohnilembus persalinus TaxID=266149 RepID=A0A0V0Q9A5_PSEPJ|nr:hypothetical protein PPERSA_03909 [Pseudocohnilembus persalinus]|eukprot:KRW98774.1 hypothetical protein PPERSA_03909 [Pseudocohnilembus persalinus]
MNSNYILISIILLIFSLIEEIKGSVILGNIQKLNRNVDLTGRYMESQINLTFENNNNQAIYTFYYAVPNYYNQTLVNILFQSPGNDFEIEGELVTDPVFTTSQHHTLYQYQLPNKLLPGDSVTIYLREIFMNRFDPLPKNIDMQAIQKLVYTDNKYFYTPYTVQSQKTTFISGKIISNTEDSKTVVRKNQVKYGVYENIQPYQEGEIKIHFENNTPLAFFKNVTKDIEVSHWGNIAISSYFQLENAGAGLKGEFDRTNRNFMNIAQSALKGLHAELPYHAWGVSYFDEIGNISTSNAWRNRQDKVVHLDIKHRFPIFGGWKSNFNLEYNLNTSRYIYDLDDNQYMLKQLFSQPFLDLVAENYQLKVLLPQGAYDIDVTLPFKVDNQEQIKSYKYLDTEGRPTLVFSKQMVTGFHNQYFYVTYRLDQFEMYKKPFLIFSFFFSFFMIAILLNRMDSTNQVINTEKIDKKDK